MKKIFVFVLTTLLFSFGFAQNNSSLIEMISIKGGTFVMGSPTSEDWREDDEAQHSVTVSNFLIGKYEVTQGQYKSVMGVNPSQSAEGSNNPVDSITWFQAVEFCNKLSVKENLAPCYVINGDDVTWNKKANGYRLPTEAEWEYACRAGTKTPFNTENSPSYLEANYYGHYPYMIEDNYFDQNKLTTKPGTYRQHTIPVGSFKPNKFGLYDMHGNVNEWCYDYYGKYPTDGKTQVNPTGKENGSLRVCRGGGWNDFAKHMRSAFRSSQMPDDAFINRGFRVVRNSN